MLDDHDAARMIERLDSRVELPADFFDKQNGPIPVRWVDLRQFPRFYFRTPAALEIQSTLPALSRSPGAVRVYVKDISRAAVAVLHSEQLFPGERLWLTVLDGVRRSTTVSRCRRIQANCYEIAALFDAGDSAD
ncbi:MAG TPA: PilZ domain-containing protein [Pirellulales bacterium]|nr:PilZ domain-containing protein [Pirellulales bacterium]